MIFPSETPPIPLGNQRPAGLVGCAGTGPSILRVVSGSRALPPDSPQLVEPDMRLRHPSTRSTVIASLLGVVITAAAAAVRRPEPPAKCAPDNGGLSLSLIHI